MHAIYLDAIKEDPHGLARTARASVRDACFVSSSKHLLPSVDLFQWLLRFSSPPDTVTMPLELATEGVGSAAYLHALAAICAASKPDQIVEFGTFLGLGTATLALNSTANILTIELPDAPQPQEIDSLNQADLSLTVKSRNRVGVCYRGRSYGQRITEMRCDSRKLDLRDHIPSADLCLIDGGHSYECISSDTSNALRALAPGGIVIWDDYFWMYPDVVRFLNELAKAGYPLVKITGTNLVVYRKEQSAANGGVRLTASSRQAKDR
jgi:predicted O-methyltransferase YrrM